MRARKTPARPPRCPGVEFAVYRPGRVRVVFYPAETDAAARARPGDLVVPHAGGPGAWLVAAVDR